MRTVKFIRSANNYLAGDIASFDDDLAQQFIQKGFAVAAKLEDGSKNGAKRGAEPAVAPIDEERPQPDAPKRK